MTIEHERLALQVGMTACALVLAALGQSAAAVTSTYAWMRGRRRRLGAGR